MMIIDMIDALLKDKPLCARDTELIENLCICLNDIIDERKTK